MFLYSNTNRFCMPTTLRVPAKQEERIDLEGRLRTVLTEAADELNREFITIEFHGIREHPKRTAEFAILHIPDNHAIGLLRAFAFTPVMLQTTKSDVITLIGFTVALQLHIDEHTETLTFREESLLETAKEQRELKEKVKGWVRDRITRWLK